MSKLGGSGQRASSLENVLLVFIILYTHILRACVFNSPGYINYFSYLLGPPLPTPSGSTFHLGKSNRLSIAKIFSCFCPGHHTSPQNPGDSNHPNDQTNTCSRGFMHHEIFFLLKAHFKAIFLDFMENFHNLLILLDCLHNPGKFGSRFT